MIMAYRLNAIVLVYIISFSRRLRLRRYSVLDDHLTTLALLTHPFNLMKEEMCAELISISQISLHRKSLCVLSIAAYSKCVSAHSCNNLEGHYGCLQDLSTGSARGNSELYVPNRAQLSTSHSALRQRLVSYMAQEI